MGFELVSKIQMEDDQEISADDTNPAWQIWRECKVGPEATGVLTGKHLGPWTHAIFSKGGRQCQINVKRRRHVMISVGPTCDVSQF